jgi:hypothetical protein
VFKLGGHLVLCTLLFLILLYCISFHIGDIVSFKFGGVDLFCLFLYIIILFCFAMLLIGHDLHHNCGLCVISVF